MHAPAPSQVRASVVVVGSAQAGGAHCVPAAYTAQAPPPLQNPVVPQLAAPCATHWLLGSLPPAGTVAQVPALPVSAQDMHVDAQVVPQQTPCAQIPVLHSVPFAQAAPVDFSPHEPPMQTAGAAQSASEAHVALQAAAPQVKGAQEVAAGFTQVPAPSQEPPAVNVVPPAGQEAAAHEVPWAYF